MTENAPCSDLVTVGVTLAVLKKGFNLAFWQHAVGTGLNLNSNPGFLDWKISTNLLNGEIWTVTVWDNDESLNAFVRSPRHREAMKQGPGTILSGGFARATLPRATLPVSWETAKIIMRERGRMVYAAPPQCDP